MLSRFSKSIVSGFKYNKVCFQPSANFASEAEDIRSVPGHKAPSIEDTPHGRYASVLFTTASKKEALTIVLEDIRNLKELYNKSDVFKNFVYNTAFKRKEQSVVLEEVQRTAELSPLTVDFLNTLIENKRLDLLPRICDRYVEYYRILNREENITIISAEELSQDDKQRVNEALKKGYAGVNFTLKYQVDPTIQGGLQMYSGNTFMDLSLVSRITRVKGELAKITF